LFNFPQWEEGLDLPGADPIRLRKWGVEGFSEVLSREVVPLGVKVTIVEPGGLRTDFAGSSTKLSEGHPEYDATVGATARFQRDYNGKQPGDPKKAAQAIVRLTHEQNPPLRLLLGSDAYNRKERPWTIGRSKKVERAQLVD
jgi:NAD(P)-dependent dehydrogenase (short-subunit alcohol dehydrogenase family)